MPHHRSTLSSRDPQWPDLEHDTGIPTHPARECRKRGDRRFGRCYHGLHSAIETRRKRLLRADTPTQARRPHPMNRILCATVVISAVAVLGGAITPSPVLALTQKECGAKYQAAKSDGSLADRKSTRLNSSHLGIS